jgi:hypothetical protein
MKRIALVILLSGLYGNGKPNQGRMRSQRKPFEDKHATFSSLKQDAVLVRLVTEVAALLKTGPLYLFMNCFRTAML